MIYRDYSQFSPEIAAQLEQDALAQKAVLWVIVRPLLAWYSLAGSLALEQADQKAVKQAAQEMLNACTQDLNGSSYPTYPEIHSSRLVNWPSGALCRQMRLAWRSQREVKGRIHLELAALPRQISTTGNCK